MKRTTRCKLTLQRETLRMLDSDKLALALGGEKTATSMLCPTITSVQCLVVGEDQ